jgi:cytidine deaminase
MVKSKNISFSYNEFEKAEDLLTDDLELVNAAKATALNAYAPYSKFRVGAAIRLESGKIICGANVENAAFPSGICAERTALSHSVSNYPNDKPVSIAIASMNNDGYTEEPPSPCGNCRQVIAEEESRTGKRIRIIMIGKSKTIIVESISDLLPLQFNKNNLKISPL